MVLNVIVSVLYYVTIVAVSKTPRLKGLSLVCGIGKRLLYALSVTKIRRIPRISRLGIYSKDGRERVIDTQQRWGFIWQFVGRLDHLV